MERIKKGKREDTWAHELSVPFLFCASGISQPSWIVLENIPILHWKYFDIVYEKTTPLCLFDGFQFYCLFVCLFVLFITRASVCSRSSAPSTSVLLPATTIGMSAPRDFITCYTVLIPINVTLCQQHFNQHHQMPPRLTRSLRWPTVSRDSGSSWKSSRDQKCYT